jgi:hypothetical protein
MANFRALAVLSLLSTAVVASPSKRSVCHAGRKTINGQQYTVSCGLDRLGGDYDRLQTSWDGCIAACGADSTCQTAQYHDDNGYCYLKNFINPAVATSGEYTVDLGSACKESTTVSLNGVQCSIECGIDRHGGDYSQVNAGNYLACASACAADSKCVTAQYNEGNGYCYLKNADNGQVSSTDTDSIVCVRSGTTTSTTSTTTTTTISSTPSPTGLGNGATCFYNRDCASNLCTSTNYCGPLNNGYFCGINSECVSGFCKKSPPSAGYGECANRANIGASCVYNTDCASGYCTLTNYCGPTPNGYPCGRNSDCQSGSCSFVNGSPNYGHCVA